LAGNFHTSADFDQPAIPSFATRLLGPWYKAAPSALKKPVSIKIYNVRLVLWMLAVLLYKQLASWPFSIAMMVGARWFTFDGPSSVFGDI